MFKRLNCEIDQELYQEFKAVCYRLGFTITEVIESFLRDYIRKNK